MTHRVPADQIEALVGAKRHQSRHIIRGGEVSGIAYILHPHTCLKRHTDLRECPWSLALDRDDVWLPDNGPHYVNLRAGQLIADLGDPTTKDQT